MRGKAIRHFLIEGQADGRWVSELSNWTGKSYKIPRTYVNSCGDRSDLNNTGVYFLFGRNDDTDMDQVYIGEAKTITSTKRMSNILNTTSISLRKRPINMKS